MNHKILSITTILVTSIFLGGCGKKATTTKVTPTSAPKTIELPVSERPLIGLTPRKDGHMLYLEITKIPSLVSSIEYEMLYTAKDDNVEIEKGLGDTIKNITSEVKRDLLLGTESCTNGCKYKYDEGITGGTLVLNFITKDGQIFTYESPFSMKSGAEINKSNDFGLATENYKVPSKGKLSASDFFTVLKNYRGGYSVFSSGQSPLVGDYQ